MDLHDLAERPPWDWPGDAGHILLAVLRDPAAEPADRELAAELAGETVVIDDTLATMLVGIVGDASEPEGLRGRAAIALGPVLETEWQEEGWDDADDKLLSPPVLARVRQMLRDVHHDGSAPRDVRRYALEASIRYPDGWHEDAVHDAFRSGDGAWKVTALFCMGYLGGFDDLILESLGGDVEIRVEAFRSAGRRELEEATPRIVEVLRDEHADRRLRLAAIEAAGRLGSTDLAEALGFLADSDDEEIREAAEEALGMRSMFKGLDEDDEEEW